MELKYKGKIVLIKSDCLKILENILPLCKRDCDYMNNAVANSDYLIYFTHQNNIVAFALVKEKNKKKGKILDVLFVYANPGSGKMIVQSICNFANTYNFIYVSPMAELREIFLQYGFESIWDDGVNEVLEKEIILSD